MTELQDILGQIPVDQIAGMLGTDRQTTQAAVEAAVPTLLAGLHSNAQAPEGAASLESALGQHQNGLVDGGVDAAQVDTADGEKIVSHVFGGRQDHASQLAGTAQLGGVSGDLVRRLLPLLAPIVMSYLAKKVLGGRGQAGGGAGSGGAGGIDLGGILGGILGGGAGGAGGGLGDILGGVLGGGRNANEVVPDSAAPAASDAAAPELQPQTAPEGQPSGGAPQPGELIDLDLPQQQGEGAQETPDEAPKNDGGLGGLLGGLFGKK